MEKNKKESLTKVYEYKPKKSKEDQEKEERRNNPVVKSVIAALKIKNKT